MRIDRNILRKLLTVILIAITVFVLVLAVQEFVDYKDAKEYKDIEVRREVNTDINTLLLVGKETIDENEFINFVSLLIIDSKEEIITPIILNTNTMINRKEDIQIKYSFDIDTDDMNELIDLKNDISSLLNDLKIDYYLLFNDDTIYNINNSFGSVEVIVLDDFEGIDDSLKQGTKVLLQNEHVLNYLKERIGKDKDTSVDRLSRQTQYLRQLYDELRLAESKDVDVFSNIYNCLSGTIESNCSFYDFSDLLKKISTYQLETSIVPESKMVINEKVELYLEDKSIKEISDLAK